MAPRKRGTKVFRPWRSRLFSSGLFKFRHRHRRSILLLQVIAMMRVSPNKFRIIFLWPVLVLLVAGSVAWQAQVTASHRAGSAGAEPLPPPVKTRRGIRGNQPAFDGNPLEAYRARCGKGLVENEIEWILDDFRAAGLDHLPGAAGVSEYLAYRRTQHRWYLDALADALHLSFDQKEEAKGRLDSIYQTDSAAYLAMLARIKPVTTDDGRSYLIAGAQDFNSILSAPGWITGGDGASLPRKLCTLTPEQEEILTNSPVTGLAPGFQELEGLLPFCGQLPADLVEDSPWDSEALAMVIGRFHPAQLKLLLLFDPALIDRVDSAARGYPQNLPARGTIPGSR